MSDLPVLPEEEEEFLAIKNQLKYKQLIYIYILIWILWNAKKLIFFYNLKEKIFYDIIYNYKIFTLSIN